MGIVDSGSGGPQVCVVTIHEGVIGGQQFIINSRGQLLSVICPANSTAGDTRRMIPPLALSNSTKQQPQQGLGVVNARPPQKAG
jgi:hypothetical protein